MLIFTLKCNRVEKNIAKEENLFLSIYSHSTALLCILYCWLRAMGKLPFKSIGFARWMQKWFTVVCQGSRLSGFNPRSWKREGGDGSVFCNSRLLGGER